MAEKAEAVIAELNECRANPRAYAAKLEKTLKYYRGKLLQKPGAAPIETEEGKGNVQSCITFLKNSRPLPALEPHSALVKAALDHAIDIGGSGETGHVGSDGSSAENRIEKYSNWQGSIGENIDLGSVVPEDIVVSLLIDDGVLDRGHRLNILSPDHAFVGVGYSEHKDMEHVWVILFAQSLEAASESKESKPEPKNSAKPEPAKAEAKKPEPAKAEDKKKEPAKPEEKKKEPLVKPKDPPKPFDPAVYKRPGYTADDIMELKEAFDMFDVDKSGSIDPSELKSVIEDFGLDAKNAAIFQMISEMDTDGSGQIEFPEFLDMISGNTADENSMEEVRKVFNVFDTDKTGFITFKNLRQMSDELGEQLSDETLRNLIAKGDSNSDDLVSFEDFYYIMTKTVL